jgi:hypothetical protein
MHTTQTSATPPDANDAQVDDTWADKQLRARRLALDSREMKTLVIINGMYLALAAVCMKAALRLADVVSAGDLLPLHDIARLLSLANQQRFRNAYLAHWHPGVPMADGPQLMAIVVALTCGAMATTLAVAAFALWKTRSTIFTCLLSAPCWVAIVLLVMLGVHGGWFIGGRLEIATNLCAIACVGYLALLRRELAKLPVPARRISFAQWLRG